MKRLLLFALFIVLFTVGNSHAWQVEYTHTPVEGVAYVGEEPNLTNIYFPPVTGLFYRDNKSIPNYAWLTWEAIEPSEYPDCTNGCSIPVATWSYGTSEYQLGYRGSVSFQLVEDGNTEIVPIEVDINTGVHSIINESQYGNQDWFTGLDAWTTASITSDFGINMSVEAQYSGNRESSLSIWDSFTFMTNTWYTITAEYQDFANIDIYDSMPRSFSTPQEYADFISQYGQEASKNINSNSGFYFDILLNKEELTHTPIPTSMFLLGSALPALFYVRKRFGF